MKKLLLILLIAVTPAIHTGCGSPTSRNATVATLLTVGHTAEAAVSLSAQLYADGKITEAQAYAVLDGYNRKFQPAYRIARTAAKFDPNAIAPLELVSLASELTNLVNSYRK